MEKQGGRDGKWWHEAQQPMLHHCQRGRHLAKDHNRGAINSLANFGCFSVAVISSRITFFQLFLLPTALFVAVPLHEDRGWWQKKTTISDFRGRSRDHLMAPTVSQARGRLFSPSLSQAELSAKA